MRTAIVTDSTSDIPYDLARDHQITVVPNNIVIDGQNIKDDENFSRRDFYVKLPDLKQLPTTATASSGEYSAVYTELLEAGFDAIVSIHASSQLSGIFNAASAAAQAFPGRVMVVDSQQVSLGLGFQALAAAESAAAGAPVEVILEHLERLRPRVRLFAMLDTLEYVRRSGRVSWLQAGLGTLLNIKLFLEVREGIVHRAGEARTRRKGLARLYELFANLGKPERLAILYTNADEDAEWLSEKMQLSKPPLMVNVTTVIGTHVGPNTLGFTGVFP